MLKEFATNTDVHKYAILWASKFYKHINKIMRNLSFEDQKLNYPYGITFIIHFIRYFDKFGITKHDLLQKNIKHLYRGVSGDYILPEEVGNDAGFMATSEKLYVAQTFATNGGNVLMFNVADIPDDIKMVTINETLADYLYEYEVLFLPGTIVKVKNSKYKYEYRYTNMNVELIHKYLGETPKCGGSDSDESECEQIPDIDLANKIVVWYRAIQNRPVEIMAQSFMPETKEETIKFFRYTTMPYDDMLTRFTERMPEYQDMKAEYERSHNPAVLQKMESYMIHMAVYNTTTKKLDTLHYGIFAKCFAEVFDMSRAPEVEAKIIATYKSW